MSTILTLAQGQEPVGGGACGRRVAEFGADESMKLMAAPLIYPVAPRESNSTKEEAVLRE